MNAEYAPLDFRFRVACAHAAVPVTTLRLAARIREHLWRAGFETLGELEGLCGRDVARLPRLDGASAVRLVEAVRWRCCERLPAWSLLRDMPVSRLWIPEAAARALCAGGCPTLQQRVSHTPETIATLMSADARATERFLDRGARLAETAPARLRAISARNEPFVLPRLDPVVLLALARADDLYERVIALTLGLSLRDSAMLLARWGMLGARPATFEELGRGFGVTSERARQVVVRREGELTGVGLVVPWDDEPTCHGTSSVVRVAARALVRRLGLTP